MTEQSPEKDADLVVLNHHVPNCPCDVSEDGRVALSDVCTGWTKIMRRHMEDRVTAARLDAAAQVSALADRLDKYAEWNLLNRKQREERWPEDHSHMVSRPQASTRARALVRDLARAISPGSGAGA